MRVAVNSHALPVYKKNRFASLPCIFETIIALVSRITVVTKENGLFILLFYRLLFYRKGYDPSEKKAWCMGKGAWRYKKRAWRSAILKGPRGNTKNWDVSVEYW